MPALEPFFSWWRLARECGVVLFIVSYIVMALAVVSRPHSGQLNAFSGTPTGRSHVATSCDVKPLVRVQCARTAHFWRVREDETIAADEHPGHTLFRIEPATASDPYNTSFVLRHMSSMRLVTVGPPGAAHEYALKLGPLVLETPFELFTVEGASIKANGIGGFVNHQYLTPTLEIRARGDKQPFAPLFRESAATKLYFRQVPCAPEDDVESILLHVLDLVARKTTSKHIEHLVGEATGHRRGFVPSVYSVLRNASRKVARSGADWDKSPRASRVSRTIAAG